MATRFGGVKISSENKKVLCHLSRVTGIPENQLASICLLLGAQALIDKIEKESNNGKASNARPVEKENQGRENEKQETLREEVGGGENGSEQTGSP